MPSWLKKAVVWLFVHREDVVREVLLAVGYVMIRLELRDRWLET